MGADSLFTPHVRVITVLHIANGLKYFSGDWIWSCVRVSALEEGLLVVVLNNKSACLGV